MKQVLKRWVWLVILAATPVAARSAHAPGAQPPAICDAPGAVSGNMTGHAGCGKVAKPPPHTATPATQPPKPAPKVELRLENETLTIKAPDTAGHGAVHVDFHDIDAAQLILRAKPAETGDNAPRVSLGDTPNQTAVAVRSGACQPNSCAIKFSVGIPAPGAPAVVTFEAAAAADGPALDSKQLRIERPAEPAPPEPTLAGDYVKDGRITYDATNMLACLRAHPTCLDAAARAGAPRTRLARLLDWLIDTALAPLDIFLSKQTGAADDENAFWIKLSNPRNSTEFDARFRIIDTSPTRLCGNTPPLRLTPATQHILPGQTVSLLAHIDQCVQAPTKGLLQINGGPGGDHYLAGYEFEIHHAEQAEYFTFRAVLLGVVLSIFLNTLLPTQRAKTTLSEFMDEIHQKITACKQIDGGQVDSVVSFGLVDALGAKLAALRQALRHINLVSNGKTEALKKLQDQLDTLNSAVNLAQLIKVELSRLYSRPEYFGVSSYWVIMERLRDAEDSLSAGSMDAAKTAKDAAKAAIDAVLGDDKQTALRTDLAQRLAGLSYEHVRGALQFGALSPDDDIKKKSSQPEKLEPILAAINEIAADWKEVARDYGAKAQADGGWQYDGVTFDQTATQEAMKTKPVAALLRLEQKIWLIETWVNDVWPPLRRNPDRLHEIVSAVYNAQRTDPKSQFARLIVELVQAELTPADLYNAIERGARDKEDQIICEKMPYYGQPYNITFRLANPKLAQLPASRFYPSFAWGFSAARNSPAARNAEDEADVFARTTLVNSYQRQYFFTRPQVRLWRIRSWIYVLPDWLLPETARAQEIRVKVSVIGGGDGHTADPRGGGALPAVRSIILAQQVLPRHMPKTLPWRALTEILAVGLQTAIALVAAINSKYGGANAPIPDQIDFAALATAFAYGFGLDQLRDTATNKTNNQLTPSPPSTKT